MRRAIAKQSRVRTVGNLRQPTKRCEKDGLCPFFSLYLTSRAAKPLGSRRIRM